MKKMNDWDARPEMNKHVIEWVEDEVRWCVRIEMIEALSLKWIRKILILSGVRWMIAGYFLDLFEWWRYDWIVQKMLSLVRVKDLTPTIYQSCTVCMVKRMLYSMQVEASTYTSYAIFIRQTPCRRRFGGRRQADGIERCSGGFARVWVRLSWGARNIIIREFIEIYKNFDDLWWF